MGDEDHPLVGLRGGDDLSLGWKPVGDFFRQIPGLPKLSDVLLLNGGGHPLALPSGSGHGGVLARGGRDENLGAGAREWKGTGRKKVWVKKGNPYPLIKAVNIERLPTRLKTRLFPRAVQMAQLDYPRPY